MDYPTSISQIYTHINEQGTLVLPRDAFFVDWCNHWRNKDVYLNLARVTGRRTPTQNNALHLWFALLADALNGAGYSVQEVLSKAMEIDWSGERVKENLWRPAQIKITNKISTTELDKGYDIDLVKEHLTRHLGEEFGIYVEFPSEAIIK